MVDALKKRRNKSDKFREVNGYSWDYMIVFQVYDEIDNLTVVQCDFSMKNILQKLSIGGLQIRLFYSIQVRINLSAVYRTHYNWSSF